MLERPQLVGAGERTGKNTKKGGIESWSPNIIGRRYQICGKGAVEAGQTNGGFHSGAIGV